MRQSHLLKHCFTAVALLASASSAYAQVQNVDIDLQDANGLPVATTHFVGESAAPVNITDVIRSDLSRSGGLINFPVGDATAGLDGANPAAWSAKGAKALVVGNVTPEGGNYNIKMRLFDTNKSLGDYSLTVPASGLRGAGHRMADFIYEKLMNKRGAFSTRLSYVDRVNGKFQLLISDSDGQNSIVALNSNEPIISPSWSPSGTKVAYVSFENKKPVVYIHDLPTGQRVMVANYKGNNSAPAWSPLLKISNLISEVERARHKRKVLTLSPRQPTTGVS